MYKKEVTDGQIIWRRLNQIAIIADFENFSA